MSKYYKQISIQEHGNPEKSGRYLTNNGWLWFSKELNSWTEFGRHHKDNQRELPIQDYYEESKTSHEEIEQTRDTFITPQEKLAFDSGLRCGLSFSIPTKEKIRKTLYDCAIIEKAEDSIRVERLFEKESNAILKLLKQ